LQTASSQELDEFFNLTDEEVSEFEKELEQLNVGFTTTNSAGLAKDRERLLRMTTVISKFASTLAARQIHVHIEEADKYPTESWSDADNIWFNMTRIKDLTDPEVIASIKGLALHEISHIMLTPRSGSNILKWAKQNKFERAFNSLEDQRIETFMTHRFSNVDDWLTSTVAKFLISTPQAISTAYVLTHGRKYLPQELRDVIRDSYVDQHLVKELGDIIDNYTVLNLSDSNHIPVAMQLIERYHNLVSQLTDPDLDPDIPGQPTGWDTVQDINGHDHTPNLLKSSEKSKPMNKSQQDNIIKKILDRRGRPAQIPEGSQEGEEVEQEPNGSNGCGPRGSGAKPGDQSGQEGQGKGQGQGQSDGTDTGDQESGGKKGGQFGNGTIDPMDVISRTLKKSIQNLNEDIKNTMKQFNGDVELTTKSIAVPPKSTFRNQVVVPEVVSASRSFSKELQLIKADYEPGWNRRVEQGKLNVQRYVTGCDVDEAFDEWDMGREDAVDIECVVLLDTSGSMSWTINEAYDSMWAIKRGMDKVGASTTVVTFDGDASILYSANENASNMKRYGGCGGGTNPTWAMRYARNILAESQRAVKILIVITDGEWYGEDSDENMKLLRASGVVTSLAFVDDTEYNAARYPDHKYYQDKLTQPMEINSHGAEITHKVNTAADLFDLARKLVRVGIVRNLS
jgi:hypothetical protein